MKNIFQTNLFTRGIILDFCKSLISVILQSILVDSLKYLKKIRPQHRCVFGRGTTTTLVYHSITSNSNAYKNLHEILIAHLFLLT